jgi:hypothetical protein
MLIKLLHASIAYKKMRLKVLDRKGPEIQIEKEKSRVINRSYAKKRLVWFVQQLSRTNSALKK